MELFAAIAAALIAAAASVVTALITVRGDRSARERQAEEEAYREERRAQESERRRLDEAEQQALLAIMDALDVSLVSLQGGRLNGNVEAARKKVGEARDGFQRTRSKALSRII